MTSKHDPVSILVVDDNANNCDLLRRRLSRKGYHCEVCHSGMETLEFIAQQRPDLILLDIMMPGIDGIEVLTRLRKQFNSVELPIIMVTAKNAHEDIILAFEKGANDYIEKPVDFPVMLARIKHHVQHKRLDDELKRSQQTLKEKNRLLDISNQYKINFLSSMSHELRTPLNAVMGYSEALIEGLMGDLEEKQKEYCKEIYDSGAYLLTIINDLLDLSKIEAGKLELHIQPTDIDLLVDGLMGIIGERARRSGVRLKINIQEDLATAQLDPVRIKQILINLLTNAIKFTDAGREVALDAYQNPPADVVFRVRDQGCGIAPADLERIFVPFEQTDASRQKINLEGTGLGLALVKRLAELHGGNVAVESVVGRGSSFTVILPFEPYADHQQDSAMVKR